MRTRSRTLWSVMLLGLSFMTIHQGFAATEKQKPSKIIAVAAVGEKATAKISDVAGRAPYFLIFDSDSKFVKAIKNSTQNQRGGASRSVVNLLNKESVDVIVAGKFGAKMQEQLQANKIDFQVHTGTAKNAVAEIVKKKK